MGDIVQLYPPASVQAVTMKLLEFWRLRRKMRGEQTIVRPCHRVKAEALTDLMLGRLAKPNMMILEPPRIGKTDLGTKCFMEYGISHFPDSEYIHGSWGSELATANVKEVRDTLNSEWYRGMVDSEWGATVKSTTGDSRGGRQDYFHTTAGGSVKAVGMGTGVIGFGAGKLRREWGGCIIIDDPIKHQDRHSPTIRETAIDWVQGLEQRRNRKEYPMTPMLLIMQRLHPNDPAGHLLKTQRNRWNIVQIPAIDEGGVSIWPAKISLAELEYLKLCDPETYWAQYMQQPSDEEYLLLRPEWWPFWTDQADVERRITLKIITADTAFKEADSSDYSVVQCWGFENTTAAYLLDQIRGKWAFPDLVKNTQDFFTKHTAVRHGITPATEAWVEDRASGTSLVQTLRREGLNFREWLPKHADQKVISSSQVLSGPDKVSRVKQCTMPISAGRVILPWPGLPAQRWVEPYVGECSAFTSDDSHAYDDQVDATTMALLIWQQRGGGVGPLPVFPKGHKIMSWTDWEQTRMAA